MKIKMLIYSLFFVYLTAFIGSLFTNTGTWYQSIKPSITPPSIVFPIVWTILFFLIGLSLYFSWIKAKKKEKPYLKLLFAFNFFTNILWSVFYFGFQSPLTALIVIIILIFSISILIIETYKINKTSSYLLIPYLLWVLFALILNIMSI